MPDEDGDKPADPASGTTSADAGSEASDDTKQSTAGATDADARSGDERSREASSADAPKKKKKKKKKRAVETEEARDEKPPGPVLNAEGWERPGFVLDFPKDAELERLVRAFELGNYAFVREHGKKLAESASDGDVRRAAAELLRRVEPDPLVKILFAMSVALFLFMVFYAYKSHAH